MKAKECMSTPIRIVRTEQIVQEAAAAMRKFDVAELERVLPLVKHGGFISGVDHRVPADVPLHKYKYYLKLKRDLFRAGGVPQYDESKI